MHPLKQYLRDMDEELQVFAARVGVSRHTIYRLISGANQPRPALARRIVEATGGSVSFEDLYISHAAPTNFTLRPKTPNGQATIGEEALDPARIEMALAIVINHLAQHDQAPVAPQIFPLAAEAVINTYVALSTVTTRQGADRLLQALRPVLAEIAAETLASALDQSALDEGGASGD